MATQIPRHPEAFSKTPTARGARRPRVHDGDHLDFIRQLRCSVCMVESRTEAAHIRSPSPIDGKRATGMAEKPDDRWTLPLCGDHHKEQHTMNEILFWHEHQINPFLLALRLWGCSGDIEIAEIILKETQIARLHYVRNPLILR